MDALRSLIPLAVLFIICDIPWLTFVAPWFQTMGKKIQGGAPITIRWEGAPPVYLALAYLITRAGTSIEAFLIGLSTYAVYDWTNYMTFAKYETPFAVADSLWGGVLFVIVREIGMRLGLL